MNSVFVHWWKKGERDFVFASAKNGNVSDSNTFTFHIRLFLLFGIFFSIHLFHNTVRCFVRLFVRLFVCLRARKETRVKCSFASLCNTFFWHKKCSFCNTICTLFLHTISAPFCIHFWYNLDCIFGAIWSAFLFNVPVVLHKKMITNKCSFFLFQSASTRPILRFRTHTITSHRDYLVIIYIISKELAGTSF